MDQRTFGSAAAEIFVGAAMIDEEMLRALFEAGDMDLAILSMMEAE